MMGKYLIQRALLCLWLAAAGSFLPGLAMRAQAQEASAPAVHVPTPEERARADEYLKRGIACYEELNYGCARKEFVAGLKLDDSVKLREYHAYTLIALGRENEAIENFIRVFEIDASFSLSAAQVSPKIYRVYRLARRQYEVRQEAQQKTLLAEGRRRIDDLFGGFIDPIQETEVSWYTVDLTNRVYMELNVGYSLIAGEKITNLNSTFEGGPTFGGRGLYGFNEHVALGGQLHFSTHLERGIPGPASLDMLTMGGIIRLQEFTETFRFFASLGGGAVLGGRDDVGDEKGWYLAPMGGVTAIVTRNLSLGLSSGVTFIRELESTAGSDTIFEIPVMFELSYLY